MDDTAVYSITSAAASWLDLDIGKIPNERWKSPDLFAEGGGIRLLFWHA